MNIEINFYGRYGEHFIYVHTDKNEYIVSCDEIDMKNVLMSEDEFKTLFDKYYHKGVVDFDKSNKNKIYSRASNLGRKLYNNFWYFKRNNDTYDKLLSAIIVYKILDDIKTLELSEDEYVNHFIKYNYSVEEEYASFMLYVKKHIIE